MVHQNVIRLDTPFRGQRNYLHSTSLFELLRTATGAIRNIHLKISRIIYEPVQAIIADCHTPSADVLGTFSYDLPDGRREWRLISDPNAPGPGRVDCNERSLMERAKIQGDEIVLESAAFGSANFIEAVVALNKRLIEQTLTPSGKLYFTEAEFSHVPRDGRLSISLVSRLGSKLFVSRVKMSDELLGKIVFIAA